MAARVVSLCWRKGNKQTELQQCRAAAYGEAFRGARAKVGVSRVRVLAFADTNREIVEVPEVLATSASAALRCWNRWP